MRDTGVALVEIDQRSVAVGRGAEAAGEGRGIGPVVEDRDAGVACGSELVVGALSLGDGDDLSVGNAASASGCVAHAAVLGGCEILGSVLLALVGDTAVASSIELSIDDLALALAASR